MTNQTQQAPEPAQLLIDGDNSAIDAMVAESGQEPSGAPAEQPEGGEEPRLFAGKYKSVEEMEKGFLALQKKLGQKGVQVEEEAQAEPAPEAYSIDEASEIYGPTIAEAAERAGLNLAEWDQQVRAGEDTASYRAALAVELGISEEVIANYEATFRPGGEEAEAGDQTSSLKALAGGDAGWQQLSTWAQGNLSKAEIEVVNAALRDETPGVAEFAVKSLMARAQGAQEVEPISGTTPSGDVFDSEDAVVKSRFARNEQGRERYLTDPKYRQAYDAKLARSKVFL